MRVAKTKALISFAVTAKLICAFVFAQAFCWFCHAVAQIVSRFTPMVFGDSCALYRKHPENSTPTP